MTEHGYDQFYSPSEEEALFFFFKLMGASLPLHYVVTTSRNSA